MKIVISLNDTNLKEAQIKLLNDWLTKWGLTPIQGARVLKIQKSKMSEFLSLKSDRLLPSYIAAHIETFNQLNDMEGKKIIEERLKF